MKPFNKSKKPKHMTTPRYKGFCFQVQRNTKKESLHSSFRNKRVLIHKRYSYKYNY